MKYRNQTDYYDWNMLRWTGIIKTSHSILMFPVYRRISSQLFLLRFVNLESKSKF